MKLFIVLFVLVPYCLFPPQLTCHQHTVLGCLSIYSSPVCETKFHTQVFCSLCDGCSFYFRI